MNAQQIKSLQTFSGDSIPALGLGTWQMEPDVAIRAVESAIESGYRHIDCAMIYLNEEAIGVALKNVIQRGVVRREDLWITSKLWNDCHRQEHVRPALEKTLADLGLKYLDLYLIHWPVAQKHGVIRPENGAEFVSLDEISLAETWLGMQACHQAGLSRNIGVSNFSIKKLGEILDVATIRPVVNQVESHPYHQQKDLLTFCQQNNILLTAYSPLGSGGRPEAMVSCDEPTVLDDPVIANVAAAHGITAAQAMIAWAISRGTIAIPKSASPDHQRENLAAAAIQLSPEELVAIAEIETQYRFIDGTFWEREGSPYTVADLWDE